MLHEGYKVCLLQGRVYRKLWIQVLACMHAKDRRLSTRISSAGVPAYIFHQGPPLSPQKKRVVRLFTSSETILAAQKESNSFNHHLEKIYGKLSSKIRPGVSP